jgi:hypothetical protein
MSQVMENTGTCAVRGVIKERSVRDKHSFWHGSKGSLEVGDVKFRGKK